LLGHPRFSLLVRGLKHSELTPEVADAIAQLDCLVIPFSENRYKDLDGRLDALFDTSGVKAILVRPDFYAFGSASDAKQAEVMLSKAVSMMKGEQSSAVA